MNKYLINGVTIVLIMILIVLSALVGINLTKLNREVVEGSVFSKKEPPTYRFMVIIDGSDANFVDEFEKGIHEGALNNNVAYEMWHFDGEDKSEKILRQFDIAIESNVDGIILQAFDDKGFDDTLQKANARNIPVITIGTDIPAQEKVSFISYNQYRMGTQIGKLLKEYFDKKGVRAGTIVLFQNERIENSDKALAINEVLDHQFNIQQVRNELSGDNALNAVGTAQNILRQYNDIVSIICSNGEETLGTIQALKDQNMINEVVVIGNDDYEEILDYVEREIIFATVVVENEKIGFEAIEEMVKHKNKEFVSQYRDINENILTRQEVLRIRKNTEEIMGEGNEE
jgi:ribose transport system substrate-binding protein